MKTLEQFVQTISEDNGTLSPAAEAASPFRNKPSKGRFTRYNKFNGVGRLPGVKSNEVNDYEKRLERDFDSARNQFCRLGESESHMTFNPDDKAVNHLYNAVRRHKAAAEAHAAGDMKSFHQHLEGFNTSMYLHMKHSPIHERNKDTYGARNEYLDNASMHYGKSKEF